MSFIRLDKVKSDAHYESIRVTGDPLKDGQFLILSKSIGDEEEIVLVDKALSGKVADAILCTAHLDYGSPINDFKNEETDENKIGRALIFEDGDTVSVSQDISNKVSVGDKVSIGIDGLGFKKSESGDVEIGMCIRKDFMTNVGELTVIRLMKTGGLNGVDGKDGLPGKDGAPGLNGVDGKDGLPGKDGVNAPLISSIELSFGDDNVLSGGKALMSDGAEIPITIKK